MDVSKITTPIQNTLSKPLNKAADSIGNFIDKHPKVAKFNDLFEANGGDNTFFGLTTIMLLFVLIPRLKAALSRNPDDKEGTKDEVGEILFRDLQTIAIMLLGLKTLNSVIGNASTKMTGISVMEKPCESLFSENAKGLKDKAHEFISQPLDKLKILGRNFLAIINPIGGSMMSNGKQMDSRYSNFKTCKEVKNMIKDAPNHGGNEEKVFNKIKQSVIAQLNSTIESYKACSYFKDGKLTEQAKIEDVQKQIKFFEDLSFDDFMKEGFVNGDHEKALTHALRKGSSNNLLVRSAKRVNDWLRMLALGIEVVYLGFGLPALNQKRLEKKYLSEKPVGTGSGDTFAPLYDRHIKAKEIKLYSNFIK